MVMPGLMNGVKNNIQEKSGITFFVVGYIQECGKLGEDIMVTV